jgi:hypothetical protein
MAFAAVIAAAAEAPWRCLAPRVVGAMAMKQMTRDWRTGGFGVANDLPLACSLTFFVGHAGTASLLCCGCPCARPSASAARAAAQRSAETPAGWRWKSLVERCRC